MMGRVKHDQGQLFLSFCLDEVVPGDHRVREIAAVLDLSWVHGELAPHYSHLGQPSIDPVLMIRMLILGYVFAIRSERLLCREVHVNLAYRWFLEAGMVCQLPLRLPPIGNVRPDVFMLLCVLGVGRRRRTGWVEKGWTAKLCAACVA
jgi:hypothetical protein